MIKSTIKIQLESCGDKAHKEPVCYLRFQKDARVKHTQGRADCMIDYDKQGNVVGIEFYDGIKVKGAKK